MKGTVFQENKNYLENPLTMLCLNLWTRNVYILFLSFLGNKFYIRKYEKMQNALS